MIRRAETHAHRDRGAAAVELPLAVCLLLLPIAMIVMLLPQWPERQTVATAAAKDAATIYANASDPNTGAELAASSVAEAAAMRYRPDTRMMKESPVLIFESQFERCQVASASAS